MNYEEWLEEELNKVSLPENENIEQLNTGELWELHQEQEKKKEEELKKEAEKKKEDEEEYNWREHKR